MLHYSVDCCLQQITVTIIPFFTYYGIIVHTREDPLKNNSKPGCIRAEDAIPNSYPFGEECE